MLQKGTTEGEPFPLHCYSLSLRCEWNMHLKIARKVSGSPSGYFF